MPQEILIENTFSSKIQNEMSHSETHNCEFMLGMVNSDYKHPGKERSLCEGFLVKTANCISFF